MDYTIVVEIVEKLVGNVEPWGESNYDEKALKNLNAMIYVVDDLLYKIYKVIDNEDRYEASMKACGDRARQFFNQVEEEYFKNNQ